MREVQWPFPVSLAIPLLSDVSSLSLAPRLQAVTRTRCANIESQPTHIVGKHMATYNMPEQTNNTHACVRAGGWLGHRGVLVSSGPRIVLLGPKDSSRGTDNPGRMKPFFLEGMTVGFVCRAASGGGAFDRRRNMDSSSSAIARWAVLLSSCSSSSELSPAGLFCLFEAFTASFRVGNLSSATPLMYW